MIRTAPVRARRIAVAAAGLLVGLSALAAVTPPAAAQPADLPHIWVYSGTQNFRHGHIETAIETLTELAADSGRFTIEFTEDPATMTTEKLASVDVTLWLSPSGAGMDPAGNDDANPFSPEQRTAFLDWIGCGGGFVGIHQAADAWHDWAEWDELVGVQFIHHPIVSFYNNNEEPEAQLNVINPSHPATAPWAGQDSFLHPDEYYVWRLPPDVLASDVDVLIEFDHYTNPAFDATWGQEFNHAPQLSWTSTFRGMNRSFYTNIGHQIVTWDLPDYQQHVLGGITWVLEGGGPDDDCLGVAATSPGSTTPPAQPDTDDAETPTEPLAATGGGIAALALLVAAWGAVRRPR